MVKVAPPSVLLRMLSMVPMYAVPSGANSMSYTLVVVWPVTTVQFAPPSVERKSAPPVLPAGAMPASMMLGETGERATSCTSPPNGPSAAQDEPARADAPSPEGEPLTLSDLCSS